MTPHTAPLRLPGGPIAGIAVGSRRAADQGSPAGRGMIGTH
jgi:hypothetical protein